MGSIGYIGGNIAYMNGGSMGIEYPYHENNSGHFPLWKPPSSYFPRGEAPPPYEEAVALAQAENLNTCTVSVATTTHRSLPMNVCGIPENNSVNEGTPPGITTNTTNLINININNAGNITSVAAGENHQVNNNYSTPPSNTHPRSTQTQIITGAVANVLPNDSNRNTTVSVCAYANQNTNSLNSYTRELQLVNPIEDNVINCNSSRSTCTSSSIRCQVQKEVQTSNQNISHSISNNSRIDKTNNSTMIQDNQAELKSNAILPPPLFDGNRSTRELTTNTDIMKTPSSSRRYHRTIPRHFTAVDPIMSSSIKSPNDQHTPSSTSNQLNTKKPTCQCPIQHVPMSYMGSNHFNSTHNSNGIFLTSLSTKLNNNKQVNQHHVKSTSFSSSGKIQTICKQNQDNSGGTIECIPNGSQSSRNTLRRMKPILSKLDLNPISTPAPIQINPSTHKIPTISKQIVSSDINTKVQTVLLHQENTNQNQPIHSILKNKNVQLKESSSSVIKNTTDILNPPFPIPFIDTLPKNNSDVTETNPVLPPKMYKNHNSNNNNTHNTHNTHNNNTHNNNNINNNNFSHNTNNNNSNNNNNNIIKQTQNPLYVSKIHTISKPNDPAHQYPISQSLRSNSVTSMRMSYPGNTNFSKSLRRNNDEQKINTFIFPQSGFPNSEKSQSLVKINSVISFPVSANHITYSLPKPSNSKMTLRTSITDVVSKVPSVITIPSPSSASTVTTPSTSVSPKISSVYNTTSHILSENNSLSPSQTTPSSIKTEEKSLPVCTTSKNCSNPKEHFLPNDTSLDDDYLSECENCKSAQGSRYYLDEELIDSPQETMTLQRKPTENEEEQTYYRTSQTLPTNNKQKTTTIKNREPWFSTIPASSSSDEDI